MGKLSACSDGSYSEGKAAQGWVVATSSGSVVLKGSGPTDGHPNLLSAFRAEISGLLALLYIIQKKCLFYQITDGSIDLFCDNKGAIAKVFHRQQQGITPYLSTDHDLINSCHQLLLMIPLKIAGKWVKGHYSGTKKWLEHHLSQTADNLATHHNDHSGPTLQTIKLPIPLPNY